MSKRRVIRASELGEYMYCARAWWLKQVVGEMGDVKLAARRTTAGERGHAQHGRAVRAYQREAGLGRALWLLAGLLLLAWLIITVT
jgi:CRISPR/Cas system-associated exonuclease Cas4 (RecB family)